MSAGRRRDGLSTLLVCAFAAAAIGLTRAPAAHTVHAVKETSDVYVLPPTEVLGLLSLGYRAALADGLWAQILVSQGLHTLERRHFENLTLLLDAVNELDPTFRPPYLLADALITFQAGQIPHDEVVKAREIMERGVKNLPYDADLWLALGQFTAFIAPSSYLEDPGEQERWRRDGAMMLARASELGAGNANIGWQALGGAGILNRAGERDAAIRFLERTLAVTDDDELRSRIQKQLGALLGEEQAEAYSRRNKHFMELWRRELQFVTKTRIFVLGPPPDPARCAGGTHADEPRCATTWRAWAERQQPRP
jgi:hypothetical protein